MEDVEKKFKEIIVDVFKVDAKKLKGTTRFIEDLHAKSIDMIELIAGVETEFNIETSSVETSQNKTIAQAVEYIKKKLKEKK